MEGSSSDQLRRDLCDLVDRFRRERYVPADVLCGLTYAEMQVVRCIARAADDECPLRPSDMARRFGITPSAVSQSVKKLERQGYIKRMRSDADSRSVALLLTEEGEELARAGQAAHEAFLDDLFAYVGADNIRGLIVTLEAALEFCEQSPAVRRCDRTGEGPCA
ncbi:MAG: MarR family transcriptional regulator [Slackia sp.]|nr:MarR family transcriptional regulator [Slackia sp.]